MNAKIGDRPDVVIALPIPVIKLSPEIRPPLINELEKVTFPSLSLATFGVPVSQPSRDHQNSEDFRCIETPGKRYRQPHQADSPSEALALRHARAMTSSAPLFVARVPTIELRLR